METIKDIVWFKDNFESILKEYKTQYRFYEEGDFGSLNQVEFNSKIRGGNIDFWGLGWLGIFIWDYQEEVEIMNVLLKPDQEEEKTKILEKLKTIL